MFMIFDTATANLIDGLILFMVVSWRIAARIIAERKERNYRMQVRREYNEMIANMHWEG